MRNVYRPESLVRKLKGKRHADEKIILKLMKNVVDRIYIP
jgi:hypothetical protein